MDMKTWTDVLGLEGMEVVEAVRLKGGYGWRLAVVATIWGGLCPDCKQPSGSRHMVREREVRDLPIAGRPLWLELQVPQFTCKHCDRIFTVQPVCLLEGRHVTVRLAEAVTDCVNASTLSMAASTYGLPESTVKAIFEQVVERRLMAKTRMLRPITKLGIDEIHIETDGEAAEPTAPGSPVASVAGEPSVPQEGEKRSRV